MKEFTSYKKAVAAVKKDHTLVAKVVGASDGWTSEVSFCPVRKRVVSVAINPEGLRVV